MRKIYRYIFVFYIFALFAVWFVLFPEPYSGFLFGAATLSGLAGVVLSFNIRPCGHAFVSQGRFFIFYPWAVRHCPKCNDDLFQYE